MFFDTDDVDELEHYNLFDDVVTHEMGHVLGFGSGPGWDALLAGAGAADPRFLGTVARGAWNELGGSSASRGRDRADPAEVQGLTARRRADCFDAAQEGLALFGAIAYLRDIVRYHGGT